MVPALFCRNISSISSAGVVGHVLFTAPEIRLDYTTGFKAMPTFVPPSGLGMPDISAFESLS